MPVHIATTVFPSWCMTPLCREPLMLLKFSQIEHTSMPLCSPGQIYNSWMPVTGSYWWEGHTCWHIETLYLARVRSKQTHCNVAFLQVQLSQMLFKILKWQLFQTQSHPFAVSAVFKGFPCVAEGSVWHCFLPVRAGLLTCSQPVNPIVGSVPADGISQWQSGAVWLAQATTWTPLQSVIH